MIRFRCTMTRIIAFATIITALLLGSGSTQYPPMLIIADGVIADTITMIECRDVSHREILAATKTEKI